jgi:hypothetical protein
MKSSIVNKLDRIRRTLDVFNRLECADTSIVTATHTLGRCLPQKDEGSVERQAEMQFALQELRDLVLEGASLEMPLRTHPGGDLEIAPFLVELNEMCSNGYEKGPLLVDLP